jgi:hypothetical protein
MLKLVLVLLSIPLWGCGDRIYPHNYKWAETACAEHAGVNYIVSSSQNSWGYCNDGTYVEFIKQK